MAGAPLGNNNAGKNKAWDAALRRAVAQDDSDRLRKAAEKLLTLASEGEQWAVKELADRLDGKSVQQIVGSLDITNRSEAEIDSRIEQLEAQLKD